ncbi:MAG: hypothetical protein LC730_03665, partial [Acidobacteria bacterium]|nr:hypothetical protein [Acidobacteriota bacterium]MCA1608543.1 hypothetical protein [Acidobacteriota bacterium]
MKSIPGAFLASLFLLIACSIFAPAQVTVSGSTGADGTYVDLTSAFFTINSASQSGNNILVEISANITEGSTAELNAGGWTSLTVRPTAVVTVQGSISGAVIKLNGADKVTIDGRIGGTGTGRDLTVRNNLNGGNTVAIWLSSGTVPDGASNNVIRNLEIACGADASTGSQVTFGILMSGAAISTTSNGFENDNNQFIFNHIVKVRYGIVTRGTTTNLNINPVVTDNIIGPTAFGPDQIGKTGIFMQADTGATVSRNLVQFVGCLASQSCSSADRAGIAIGTESWSATDTQTLTSASYSVTKNVVRDIVEEKTSSAVGIKLATTQGGGATNNLVANNFVFNVRANGTTGEQLCGIGIAGGNGDKVVFNSISITGDIDPGSAQSGSVYGNAMRIPG